MPSVAALSAVHRQIFIFSLALILDPSICVVTIGIAVTKLRPLLLTNLKKSFGQVAGAFRQMPVICGPFVL